MANLEVSIGADKSEFDKKIKEIEFDIKELSKEKSIQIKAGLDTTEITKNIKDAKKSLADLKTTLKDTGSAFDKATPKVANAGNTLTNFSRIAQDAPFGIMGIGNNITATAEAFSSLSQNAGGAKGALAALGSSLMGGGGVLLAISLVTSGLTYMSQQGLTVGDVFNKLTGNFDSFSQSLREANKEAAKNAAEQLNSVGAYVSTAKDINLSMQERLIAVKKLQDEYPAYFGNLTKEQILNGNVGSAVKDVTEAIKAKARAQAYAGKLGALAEKEVDLRDKEADLIKKVNKYVLAYRKAQDESTVAAGKFDSALANAAVPVKALKERLADLQGELRDVLSEMNKWADKSKVEVKASIKLDFDPDKIKKPKAPKKVKLPKAKRDTSGIDLSDELAAERKRALSLIGSEGDQGLPFIVPAADEQFKAMLESMRAFDEEAKSIITGSIADTFGQLGTAIGESLVSGGNVLLSIGQTILQGLGNFLSEMGGMLIKYGTLAVVKGQLDLAIATGGPVSIAAGLAAIGVGVALKATGGAIGSLAKSGGSKGSVSAGNSVSSPVSSVASASGSSSFQNVVFEISGQSLVGVLSNTLNKNIKLGGVPAI